MSKREMMLQKDSYRELVGRYQRFYGLVAEDQNFSIIEKISGKNVLEIGCGYGQFTSQAKKHFQATGADHDFNALRIGKLSFKGNYVQSDTYSLCFRDKSFDTIVLRETAHHLDMQKAWPELERVTKKEIIIFDPNIMLFLRMARKIIRHRDYEAPLPVLLKLLTKYGCKIKYVSYRDVIAFPLSGGLVGKELIPHFEWLERLILTSDHILNSILSWLGIEKHFCWRYIIVAEMP